MIRIFYIENNQLAWSKDSQDISLFKDKQVVWVDVQSPNEAEKKEVEKVFNIEFQTTQEAEEIESSSRYYEDKDGIEANSTFLTFEKDSFNEHIISFLLKNGILYTKRTEDQKTFAETVRALKNTREGSIKDGSEILTILVESRIDVDADYIEHINRQINLVSRTILKEKDHQNTTLITITELQENAIMLRGSISDKQRLVSSLLKSMFISDEKKERLMIVVRDINSLIQHINFSFERLEYLQNTFLGLVNVEQNQIIKIFTVAAVIFMPPTLIASIYGMNFQFMPELGWKLGYPFSIGMMLLSSLVTVWYFKRKKWL